MYKRITALLLTAVLLLSLLAACGSSESTTAASEEEEAETTETAETEDTEEAAEEETEEAEESSEETAEEVAEDAAEEEAVEVEEESLYPIFEEMTTFTIFGSASAQFLGVVDMETYSQTGAVQALEAATNVSLDYSQMTNDDVYSEKLTLLIASGDYPDFICKADGYYATGAEGLLNDEVCIDMAPYLEEYAPDLYELLQTDTDYANELYTDAGYIVTLYMRAAPTTDGGGIIRQDWLDELGLDVPETYDELYDVLIAFKNEYGTTDTIGVMSTLSSPLNYGFNIQVDSSTIDWVVHDGVVSSNVEEEAMLEYVTLLAQYYEEGLFSSDFLSYNNAQVFDDLVAQEKTGFWSSGRMAFNGTYEESIQDPDAVITAIKDITKTGTETSNIGGNGSVMGKNGISITTANEYPEESVTFINYLFTDEGIELANYGIEGDTFVYEDGEPVYTDVILNNEDGFNSNVARSLYTLNAFLPYYQTQEALELTFTSERMAEAEATWSSTRSSEEYSWDLDSEESEEYNSLASSVNTYMEEQMTAFVVGQRDLSEWDEFIEELYSLDLDRITEIQQQAFDRKYAS